MKMFVNLYFHHYINEMSYFINGLGGTNIRDVGNPITGSESIYNDDHGAQLIIVDDQEMTLEFHSLSDGVVDSKTIIDALPVELAFFAANLNGNNVELHWRTETEINNYGFNIERRTDISEWLSIGFVEGHGNSNSPKDYSFTDTDINQSGTYYYRLKQIDNDGTYEYFDVITVEAGLLNNFYLAQNYPNPFNPETRIEFTLPEKQLVSLRIYNMLGELVEELINEEKEAGSHSIIFDGSKLPSGVYNYRLKTSTFTANKKMILIK